MSTAITTADSPQPAPPSPWGGSDEARRAGLRRMKMVATGLFVLAAVIYAVTLMTVGSSPEGWLGYLQAGAEAAMIGALADWFAVTALFRHPLGLPIPHTAIIPTRKDQMGATLGEFVGTHFLTDDVVREKVGAADAGVDMVFDFPQLIAHLARTRNARSGTIVGSGTVSNRDPARGYSCIAEKRARETIADGRPATAYMSSGDTVRIEMFDAGGASIFGAIEQKVVVPPRRRGCACSPTRRGA